MTSPPARAVLEITSLVYVDKIFGTLLFAPVTATPACTLQ